jgi:hypothetical protein
LLKENGIELNEDFFSLISIFSSSGAEVVSITHAVGFTHGYGNSALSAL